jgi:hypothetical protein
MLTMLMIVIDTITPLDHPLAISIGLSLHIELTLPNITLDAPWDVAELIVK